MKRFTLLLEQTEPKHKYKQIMVSGEDLTLDEAIEEACRITHQVVIGARIKEKSMNRERGQALIEAVFAVMIFTFLFLGGADFFWAERTKASIEYIVQRSAVCSTVLGCSPSDLAYQNLATSGLSRGNFLFTANPDGSFTGSYVYQGFSPFFNHGLVLSSTARP